MTQTLTTKDGAVVPSFLSGFNVESGASPPPFHRLRIYLLGLPGSGKTTLSASMADTLYVDPEDSHRFVVGSRSMRCAPADGAQADALINKLCSMRSCAPGNPLRHVVIDTAESFLSHMIPWMTTTYNAGRDPGKHIEDIREYGQKGAGWAKVNEQFLSYLRRLYAAGYGWTVVGHLKEIILTLPGGGSSVVLRALVNDGIMGGLYRDAQFVGMIRPREIKEVITRKSAKGVEIKDFQRKRRYILEFSTPDTADVATRLVKDRLGKYMPNEIDVTDDGMAAVEAAYNSACTKAQAEESHA